MKDRWVNDYYKKIRDSVRLVWQRLLARAKPTPKPEIEKKINQKARDKPKKKHGLIEKIINFTNFALPIKTWHSTREIVTSILLASFLINLLSLVFPLTLLQVYDRIIPNQSVSTLVWLVIAVFIAITLTALLRVLRSYVGAWADAKFEHIVGCKAFNTIMQCSLSEYEGEGTGKHLKRINALNTMRDFYAGQAMVSLVDVPFVVIFLLLIGYIAGWLVLVPIAMISLLLFATFMSSDKMRKLLLARQDHDNRRLNFIVETLSKIHTIKSNTMEAQMLRRYERLQKSSALYDYKVTQRGSYVMSESMTLSQLTIVLVVAFGATMVFDGGLTVGGLAACTLLAGRCLQPVSALMSVWNRLQSVKIARDEFDQVLNMKSESQPGLKRIEKVQGNVEFRDVCLDRSDKVPFSLDNFTLKVPAKKMVSICGEGIVGKNTLFWLLLKLIKPTKGKILLDNQDISELEPYGMREHMGCMSQDAPLFQGTILDNLTMFESELEDQAIEAAEKVGLASVVQHLPDGYDTKVGQQAVANLARGVAQRIIITRALVRNPPIILFDEANIALDMEADEKLRTLMQDMIGKHTIILISHRPSYLSLAEYQYVFESGKLRLKQ